MVTMNGEECHNEWEITFEEIHRNNAIAFAIFNYSRYTDDYQFLSEKGIEILIGICRFWAQRVSYSYKKKKYVITTSWITKTLKGGYSHNHRHRNSFWSGVYYFQDEYEDGSAELCFSNPNEQLADVIFEENDIKEDVIVNSNSAIFNPEPKLLLLFPSYLGHQILHHGINTERLSLAFNIMPTVQWGGADSAININWFKL